MKFLALIIFSLAASQAHAQVAGCDIVFDSPPSQDFEIIGAYEVEIGGENSQLNTLAWEPRWETEAPMFSCADMGASTEGSYTVRVRAMHINGVSNSAWSETVPFDLDNTGGVRTLSMPAGLRVVPR